MNKITSYLQEHIAGEILTSAAARRYFSTDASVLSVAPLFVVYPKNAADIRKIARFSWQLAEKGHKLPITARGRGTDLSGAAIGSGLVMVFPAHMNRLLEMDTKQKLVRLQPGMNFRTLQDVLETHNLFLPPYPASYNYSSVGGAIANNSAGEKTLKYGSMREYVRNLEVILSNGDVIQTKRLNKRELSQKQGLDTFEGEIYRQLDSILTDNAALIDDHDRDFAGISKRASGYSLFDIKRADGSFDLTPLLVGSQGTLGIVSEAIVSVSAAVPSTTLVAIECEDIDIATAAIEAVTPLGPSTLEMVDKHLLKTVGETHPTLLEDLVSEPYPGILLLAEFDDDSARKQQAKIKKLQKLLQGITNKVTISTDAEEQEDFWAIRRAAAFVMSANQGGRAALPFIEDAAVPPEKFKLLLNGLYALLEKYHLEMAVWGHAGDANLHVQPLMDLSQLSDRQRLMKLMTEYNALVIKLGGIISAEHNDGRLRAPFLQAQHGDDMLAVFKQVKKLFDPYGILNPGVKFGTDLKGVVGSLRTSYSIEHLHDYLPYS
ncbi:FAD-binding protein [Candidatus Saccharibacteria bacterium]|nr:FAD-binding protein [Candidatus Saccharibacteria bacterium]